MNKSTVTTKHLFRGACCFVLAIGLAGIRPAPVQAKSPTDGPNTFANVNVSLAAPVADGPGAGLVTNGGFETGDFTGWTQSGNTGFSGVSTSQPHTGTFAAFFGPVGSNGFISQNLTTTVGNLYDLAFWLENDGTVPNHFEVSWAGGVLDSIDNGAAMAYTLYTFPGLGAISASTELKFGFRNDSAFWRLDDVSVVPHVVKPQPDFNDDFSPDLLLFPGGSARTAFWFLNNNMLLSTAFGPRLSAGYNVIDAADFDGDGSVDLVLFNPTIRRTAIWYFSGTNFVTSSFGPTLPPGWSLVAVGDFNGDAQPDFVLFNPTTRRTAIWFLNNNIFVTSGYGPTLPPNWSVIGVADFNRDGRPDYALFNAGTRQTAIWYLDENVFVSSAFGPTLQSGYVLIGVADFNLNGAPDFLLFKTATRQTAIWYLDNNHYVSGLFGPTLPAGWTVVVP